MEPDRTAPSLRLVDVQKRFALRDVLDGISFDVFPGQVFGYLGPNGAGKSTTVKILIGLLAADGGRAEVCGLDVAKHPLDVRRRIGYVPESAVLYDTLTVFETLQLVGRLHDLDDALIEARMVALLDAFDLGSRMRSRVGGLSKGMRQKLMLCGALLHDPDVLFLDEPLSGLDVSATMFVKEVIRALADSGKTIFYCSHMMDVVERVCDRIVILADGKLVADGTFEEIAALSDETQLEKIFAQITGADDGSERAARVLDALAVDV